MSRDAIHVAIVEDDVARSAINVRALLTRLVVRGSTLEDEVNLADVVNVGQRVGVEHEEISEFAALDRPLLVAATNGPRRIDCG